jgi:hypothetical protein
MSILLRQPPSPKALRRLGKHFGDREPRAEGEPKTRQITVDRTKSDQIIPEVEGRYGCGEECFTTDKTG